MGKLKVSKDPKKTADAISRKAKSQGKKAMRRVMKKAVTDLRGLVPVQSGALRASIASKVDAAGKGKGAVYGVVGVRSRYEKKGKIPNLYARKAASEALDAIEGKGDQYRSDLEREIKQVINEELKK